MSLCMSLNAENVIIKYTVTEEKFPILQWDLVIATLTTSQCK